ncbi:Glycosyltransferase, catalytic subunit of cellulose synthase and poly-beta-1,6-N-acetylglucosamine synthase [Clostridium cavendishii DSM 21758]|uniref:Glycosyltransferase, catalytic subunit of cellulose synthase and poly-beta-1,6-N-acetylglucosamine synthase n=1 Tax=Clostridium cavendishii DSM 21758 TaxID=1121302 RepID=A0A1M6GAX4_9CLOT|nr:glycosyltransferase [Clostridium cavendishii]SHJ07118.1 Glycosyltransferase, catalytic subunit of cellulose synthase and poly-beta-1,6-N-acetylglucosamine synthase [Clostridium cavendishii DSM 21758]
MQYKFVDYVFLFCIMSIWILLLYNGLLTYFGYKYSVELSKYPLEVIKNMNRFPKISILIPAHNEELVIGKTVLSILKLDYPKDKMEVIVINDNSSDGTGRILKEIQDNNKDRDIKVITTNKENGGKGKSNALNLGYNLSKGEFIVIYDADNTPEPISLRILAYTIDNNKDYGAVIGKFRTRNKRKNILTKFINIEGLSFQWMAQGGRWKIFNLCTIPGTNFILRRSIIEQIGGWDTEAIAEDTEISIRIYQLGSKICFMPLAVTWEQEPETMKIWFKQRTRWVKGNVYVLWKYLKKPKEIIGKKIAVDIYYYFGVYFLFLISLIASDIIFILGLFTSIKVSVSGVFVIIWLLSYVMFVLQVNIALSIEKGEANRENFFLVLLSYFTYCQMWFLVTIKGVYAYIQDKVLGKKATWYKTERFE